MRFDKSAIALKRFRIPLGAAAVLSLLMAAWSPTATATTPCDQLQAVLDDYFDSRRTAEYPIKPQNVEVEAVNRRSKLTPDRRRRLTPAEVVPVVNRRAPRGSA